ncbi:endo-1,4-beta-xylanase [Acaryochloris sp. IP29b_bin.137]|uniref:endo-1,4-beta-xylanase n=1 Tax=Acaryochloris sp. IP29b_bin.137 TaxID=2969217 RepID=UPI002620985F|nr:endo-1,4-beta-xylanase [Acaryochloris sp. IP29b_bin.137]
MKRRELVLGLGAVTGAGVVIGVEGWRSPQSPRQQSLALPLPSRDAPPLRKLAAQKNLLYGAATQKRFLASDPIFAKHFKQECGLLTPEVELKWKRLRPTPNDFNFKDGDWLADFAVQYQMAFRGHTLVWHKGFPPWFEGHVNALNARDHLLHHIETVVGHYAGRVHSWDVVNEVVFPIHNRRDGLRENPWLQMLGPDYIEMAFRAAAAADPDALMVYNEVALDFDENDKKRAATLALLQRLKAKNVPIHALGMQGHLRGKTQINPNKLKAFLREVSALGLKILITELDVTDRAFPRAIEQRDRQVAKIYAEYLSVVLQEPAVIALITWGLSDRYIWLKNEQRVDGAPPRPLLLDEQMNRKLAWSAIANNLKATSKRSSPSLTHNSLP